MTTLVGLETATVGPTMGNETCFNLDATEEPPTMTTTIFSLRSRATPALVALAVALSGAAVPLSTASAATHHHRSKHKTTHHKAKRRSAPRKSGIPQNGGGDNDSDNHGAPSDGDGNL